MARPSIWLDKFDRDNDFVTWRPVKAQGVLFAPGEPFDKTLVSTRTLRVLFEGRKIRVAQVANDQSLIVKHIGRGKFGVFGNGERLTDQPMSREQAEAFAKR